MDEVTSSALFATCVFIIGAGASRFDKRVTIALAAACALCLGLDDLITGLPNMLPSLDVAGGNWNWTGKLFSLLLSCLIIVSLKIPRAAVGLRLPRASQRLIWLALLGFVVWGSALGLLFKPGVPNAETLLFQASMPGLAEELVYRGIAPAILLGLRRREPSPHECPWTVVVATSVMFGAWHALSFAHGSIQVDPLSGLFPMIGSVVGGWLRFRTDSLLLPVLGHSIANVAFHIAGGVGA